MSKYRKLFFLFVLISSILFFIFKEIYRDGNPAEDAIHAMGSVIVLLLSFIAAQMFYLIDVVKRKK